MEQAGMFTGSVCIISTSIQRHTTPTNQIRRTFSAVTEAYGGSLTLQQSVDVFKAVRGASEQASSMQTAAGSEAHLHSDRMVEELVEEFWWDWGIPRDGVLTIDHWQSLMEAYLHRNAEQTANMFVVNATTPAQLFHVLRRQVGSLWTQLVVVVFPSTL
jgi:hypothetical protein